ncbi:MAG TPA: PRC-barrel domain-containing protein [Candidatus Methylomirabilis sp.]|nr:PRC-barrel domain-containing protein [Candidatus Methylomirabilis sp.]
MLRGINDLKRFTIAAKDGNLGRVGDVYFDDRSWSVRYLVVDAGDRLPGRRVLVPPIAVRSADPTTLRVALSTQQVADSPDGSTRGVSGSSPQQGGVQPAKPACAGESGDGHLQTATAVMGYAIQTEDGEIGHVKDVLVDDQTWAIRYLVVDTENRWAGKKVVVSPAWLAHVTWDASKTLCCIATAVVDNSIGGGRQRFHRSSIGKRPRVDPLGRTAPGRAHG